MMRLGARVTFVWRYLPVLAILALTGCARVASLENAGHRLYAPEQEPAQSLDASLKLANTSWTADLRACSALHVDGYSLKDGRAGFNLASATDRLPDLRLSRGDVLEIRVSSDDEFDGRYAVDPNGRIELPYLPRMRARGLTTSRLEQRIEAALVRHRYYEPGVARVSVRTLRYGAIPIQVSGAVFQPGRHVVNEPRGGRTEDEAARKVDVFGGFSVKRRLTTAIQMASGVRPDADITGVVITRRRRSYLVDLRGVLDGRPVYDPVLEEGDQVYVPSRGCFQADLVRPSGITPRGIRIYISKMHFAADARYDEKVPYGLRLLNAAIMASCIGGNYSIKGHREIVLVSKNPKTRATEVVQRSVEELLRHQNRDLINPYLMPDDGVACYDSPKSEKANIAESLKTLVGPVSAIASLINRGF